MDLSERNRKVAIKRWRNQHAPILKHLESMEKRKYLLLKSRIHGFISGDGSVSLKRAGSNNPHYDIRFYPDDTNMLKVYLETFEKLYLKKPAVREMKNFWQVHATSKIACQDILSSGPIGTMSWKIPEWVCDDLELSSEWLRAFFDCEGHVGKNKIQIQSVNEKGITMVKNVLEKFGIFSTLTIYERKEPNWNTNFIISISTKSYGKLFKEKINFNNHKKLTKLHAAVA